MGSLITVMMQIFIPNCFARVCQAFKELREHEETNYNELLIS